MKMTLKEGVDITSLTLQHNILVQATILLEGREGVLETEKLLFLMLSFVNNIIEEDLIEECNTDERDLMDIMADSIEPFFKELIKDEIYKTVWNDMSRILLNRCQEIWDNQHSTMGLIDAILTAIANIPEETQKEALIETAKIAEAAFDRRTEKMAKASEEANDKLQALVEQYKRAQDNVITEKEEDKNDK